MPIEIVINRDAVGAGLVERVADAVGNGQVVVCPTDTFYALVADASNTVATERIFSIKGRRPGQPLPLMAATLGQVAARVGTLPDLGRRLASTFWPGPLTLVISAHETLCYGCRAEDGSAAVRVPNQSIAREIALRIGGAVTATSANLSGRGEVRRVNDLDETVRQAVDVIVDAGTLVGGAPSTIVDARDGTPRLVRAGAVAWDRVLESLT